MSDDEDSFSYSSIAEKMTYPLGTMYNGTKFAVEGISEELRPFVAG